MPDEPIRYCYSTDQEEYHGDFATREEAAEAAFIACDEEDNADQENVWTAEMYLQTTPMLLPDADYLAGCVIDAMRDAACEVWDESEWPDVSDEDEKDLGRRLAEVVQAWAADGRVPAPDFWTCERVKEHVRTIEPKESP